MSEDKRKKCRVQGGWASNTGNSARSDSTKTPVQPQPAWLGKTVDCPTKEKFVFKEPEEEIKEKPSERVIDKYGVYDLSKEPTGVSRIRFFPNFIEQSECQHMFDDLFHSLPWKQRCDVKDGVEYLQPRFVAWFGDLPYTYSGVSHQPNKNWTPLLRQLKDKLEDKMGLSFNSLLANLYRDGHDHVGWHSDDEPGLGTRPTIASLSFGDTRTFELRKKPAAELVGSAREEAWDYTERVRVPLEAGSLLIMEDATQDDWQHRIKKEYHDRGPRINLTFRVIYPEP